MRRPRAKVNDLGGVLAEVALAGCARPPGPALGSRSARARGRRASAAAGRRPDRLLSLRLSDLLCKVGVDPVRGRLGAVDNHNPEGDHDYEHRGRKAQIHDRDREPAGDPDAMECADERLEQQRDDRGDEEEQDDVRDRARKQPRRDEHARAARQAGSNAESRSCSRRRRGHRGDRSARILVLRPPAWDWSLAEDGSLALDPHKLRDDSALQSRPSMSRTRAQTSPMQAPARPVTVRPGDLRREGPRAALA